jgi:hypothetical protein
MHMRNRSFTRLTPVFLGLALSGCAGDAEQITAPAFAHHSVRSHRISGVCNTEFVPPAFPPPPVFQQVDVGSCVLSHLGRVALYSLQEIDIVNGTQTSIEITYTAANGDVLRAVNFGTNTPDGFGGVRFLATSTFVGGTGRFASATGEVQIEGTASFVTNTASYTVFGWISYDASQRSIH